MKVLRANYDLVITTILAVLMLKSLNQGPKVQPFDCPGNFFTFCKRNLIYVIRVDDVDFKV